MGFVRNGVRIRLLAAAAITAMAIATPVRAQEGQRREYNVEAQNLGDALRTVSRLSGREVIFTAEAVEGKKAPRLRGTYTPDEAVRALLDGSGLTAEFRKDVVLIRGRSEAPGEVADDPAGQSDILVTGTRIRGAESASPVISATRSEIERQGLTDLGSFSRTIAQNFSGGQNPGVTGSGAGGENVNSSSALNLRGLGPDATLTLINGHRVAYDSAVQGVDISSIPLVAVDRVEVVADGASALYGSDAVGGVANVVLRRDYQGLLTSARFGAATDGGYVQQQYSLVAGDRWSSGGFMAAFDFNQSTAITADQRSYTSALDPSATLFPAQKQYSGAVAGHQSFGRGISLELDAQFSDRSSNFSNPALTTTDVRVNGVYSDRRVRMYSVSPRLRVKLSPTWEMTLSGTQSASDTDVGVINYVGGLTLATIDVAYHNRLSAAEFGAEGPLFAAPGGSARLAFGGGYRSIRLDGSIAANFGGTTLRTQDFTGKREILFGYGELSVPLIDPSNALPLINRLSFTGALRYEEYRQIGGLATPKVGLLFEPNSDISLKATWGKSFKAPTLYQEFSARQGFLLPGSLFQPQAPGGNPVLMLGGAGQNLKPEKATSWTTTVALKPKFLDGFRLELSYFNLNYRQRIVQPLINQQRTFGSDIYRDLILYNPSAQQVLDVIATLPTGLTNQTGAPFDPGNVSAIVDNRYQNAARQSVQGIDFAASYRGALSSVDQLELNANASYLESDQQLSEGQPTVQRAGTVLDPPHWRARGLATWTRGNFSLSGAVSYIGGTLDDRFQPFVRVGSFTSFDLNARLRTGPSQGFLSGIDVIISVVNLANEKPSLVRTADDAVPPYDSTNYPSAGRGVSITLSKVW